MTDTNPAENNPWGEQFPSPMPSPLPQAPAPFGYGNATPPPVAPQQPSNPYSQPQQAPQQGYNQIPQAPAQGYAYPSAQAPYAQQQPQQGSSPFNNPSYGKPKNSDKLGKFTFFAMVAVAVVSLILSVVTGLSAAEIAELEENAAGYTTEQNNHLAFIGLLMLLNMVGGTILGLACLGAGIFAWVKDRGRKWAIAATVLSIVTPVISFVLYLGVIASTMA